MSEGNEKADLLIYVNIFTNKIKYKDAKKSLVLRLSQSSLKRFVNSTHLNNNHN